MIPFTGLPDNSMVLQIITNPNYLLFWFFWGMTGIAIMIKAWNPLMRYKWRVGCRSMYRNMSDKDLIKHFQICEDVYHQMLVKYPDHKRDSNEIDLRKEYFKRFGNLDYTPSKEESKI